VADADREFLYAARALSASRAEAAAALDSVVQAELPPLKLERARFITQIDVDENARDPSGFDKVEFWAQTNPGTRPGPMMKVASGGELSRFMLAMKVVLADRGTAPTLVFDEIDTGIGGRSADPVGRSLWTLARRHQVLCVTHLPQIAAYADAHFRILKTERVGRTVTEVTRLDPAGRVAELAQMIGGPGGGAAAAASSRELLDRAQAWTAQRGQAATA
jgi:DNA repair protein RecN (Recombination protein N)